jgi:ArsR family transcriptional regulator, arsenate/arsenite/antimonite-responsive transcriptional repressor
MTTSSTSSTLSLTPAGGCCGTLAPASLEPSRAEQLANLLKALADPTRLRMLNLLAQQTEPLCVCDITAQFDQHQPTISHHLRLLREAGLVDCEKRGVWAYYWVTEVGRQRLLLVEALA